jgi:hypothetical protein
VNRRDGVTDVIFLKVPSVVTVPQRKMDTVMSG